VDQRVGEPDRKAHRDPQSLRRSRQAVDELGERDRIAVLDMARVIECIEHRVAQREDGERRFRGRETLSGARARILTEDDPQFIERRAVGIGAAFIDPRDERVEDRLQLMLRLSRTAAPPRTQAGRD